MAGCLKVSAIEFKLSELIDDCVKLIQIQIGDRDIKLVVVKALEIPLKIISDPHRLKQILLNLLSNSIKFTKSGSITLEIGLNFNKLKFSVSDTGIGIPENKISMLFKQFGKIEESPTVNPQGVGLGLFISDMIVYKLGGNGIGVTSKEGFGSCFWFEIELKENAEPGVLNTNPNESFITSVFPLKNPEKPKILIVDDIYFIVLALKQTLELEGIVCEYASNGKEAIEKIESTKYMCVLLDFDMPEMNGWETASKLKELRNNNKITLPPIIGNSSYCDEEMRSKSLLAGMDDLITKPCSKEELITKVKYWIDYASKSYNNY